MSRLPRIFAVTLLICVLTALVAGCGPAAPPGPDTDQNRAYGMAAAAYGYGWIYQEWVCLEQLWSEESGWNQYADNPNSDAYGIPQALPGSKMGPGWQSDPHVQIDWGLGYIAARYGHPCGALAAKHSRGWY